RALGLVDVIVDPLRAAALVRVRLVVLHAPSIGDAGAPDLRGVEGRQEMRAPPRRRAVELSPPDSCPGTSQEPTRAALDPLGVSTRLDQLPHRAHAGPTRRDVDHVVAVDDADASALTRQIELAEFHVPSPPALT